jgi:hypothetical protein
MDTDRPFTRQYNLYQQGLNGVPAALFPMSVVQTNESYVMRPHWPIALLFSRGGFLTHFAQALPHEKTLMAVYLKPLRVCEHAAGKRSSEVRDLLDRLPFREVGTIALLRWGHTFSCETALGKRIFTLRPELCESGDAAEEPGDAPDSPPPFQRSTTFEPINFY